MRVLSLVRRLRAEFKALIELVLLPGLALILPWSLCYRLFWQLSRAPFLYRARCRQSLAAAQRAGFVDDPVRWIRRYRLMIMIDHADLYLSRSRGDRWMERHLRREGSWPDPGNAFVGCTFHWGAGMWGLRDIARAGLRAHALVGRLQKAAFRGQYIIGRYSFARVAEVGRALGTRPLDVSRDLSQLLRLTRRQDVLVAAVDVPPDEVGGSIPVCFLGRQISVPRGIFRLAAGKRLPVVFYLTGFDFSTGERFLHITDPVVSGDAAVLAEQAFAELESWVTRQPECWHFWFALDRFTRGKAEHPA